MTKELEQAADEWVEKYAFRVPYDGSNEFYDKEADKHGRAGFIAGATSPAAKEYWKRQVIEAIKKEYIKEFGSLSDGSERDGYFITGFVIEAMKTLTP